MGEDLYTLMNVINPVYSDESGYLDFGTNCPEICPPAGTLPLAAEIISQAEVDGLVIGFADGGDEPGF